MKTVLRMFMTIILLAFGIVAAPAAASAKDSGTIDLPISAAKFDVKTREGYQYTVEFSINAKLSYDVTKAKPGFTYMEIDYSDSSFSVTNKTEQNKEAPLLSASVMPSFFNDEYTGYQTDKNLGGFNSDRSDGVIFDTPTDFSSVWDVLDSEDHITFAHTNLLVTQLTQEEVMPAETSGFGGTVRWQSTEGISHITIAGGSTEQFGFVAIETTTEIKTVPDEVIDLFRNDLFWIVSIYDEGDLPDITEDTTVYGVISDSHAWMSSDEFILYDPIAAMGKSSSKSKTQEPDTDDDQNPSDNDQDPIDSREHAIEYKPKNCNQKTTVGFTGDVDEVFTTQSDESLKAFATVFAASENSKMRRLLKDLGFEDIKQFQTKGLMNNTAGWFAHKKMADGRDLVFTFVNGTKGLNEEGGIAEWLSDLNVGISNILTGQDHYGFSRAASHVRTDLGKYLTKHGIEASNAFFSIEGYSRGAAIANLIASSDLLGTTLSADNSLAYTFGTPDSTFLPTKDTPWITNIVSGNDPFDSILPGWGKYGTTLGYDYVPSVIEGFFGCTPDTGFFRGHQPDNYIANVMTSSPKDTWASEEIRITWESCPTNIMVVYDNRVVGSVINGVDWSDGSVEVWTDGESKLVLTPDDDGYQVITEATGNGVMSVLTNGSEDPDTQPIEYTIRDGEYYEIDFSTGEAALLDGWDGPKPPFSAKVKGFFAPIGNWFGSLAETAQKSETITLLITLAVIIVLGDVFGRKLVRRLHQKLVSLRDKRRARKAKKSINPSNTSWAP